MPDGVYPIERSRRDLTTKNHALVDGLGHQTHLHLSAGKVHDVVGAPTLIDAAQPHQFIDDKAYDANSIIEGAEAKGMNAVIPPKSQRKELRRIDFHIYKERHLIEKYPFTRSIV